MPSRNSIRISTEAFVLAKSQCERYRSFWRPAIGPPNGFAGKRNRARVCRIGLSCICHTNTVSEGWRIQKAKKNKAESLVFKVSRDLCPFPVAAARRAKI
jgi:hypothetical protein